MRVSVIPARGHIFLGTTPVLPSELVDLLVFNVSHRSFPLKDSRPAPLTGLRVWGNINWRWPENQKFVVRLTERTPLVIKGSPNVGQTLSVEVDIDRVSDDAGCFWAYWNNELGHIERGFNDNAVNYNDGSLCGYYTVGERDRGKWFVVHIGNDWSKPVGPVPGRAPTTYRPPPSSQQPDLTEPVEPEPVEPEPVEPEPVEPEEEEVFFQGGGGCAITGSQQRFNPLTTLSLLLAFFP